MTEPARNGAVYEDLLQIPENMTGEIIDGELIATPRPSRKHTGASSALGFELAPTYQFGRGGGPGGWIFIVEPEIGLGEHILVPDLAAWRKERFPYAEETNWISIPPDWVCEVMSPATYRIDRTRKMTLYARHGIPHIWLVDPLAETVEVFKLESGRWFFLAAFSGDEEMRVEPFDAVGIDLAHLWLKP